MRMRRSAAAAVTVALAAGLLAGCSEAPQVATVAVALARDDGRWSGVADLLRDRLTAAGYAVDVRAADDDIPTQVRQVDELLAADPVALIVAPVDVTSLTTALDAAPEGVEVVSLGTLIRDTAAVDRFVAFDAAAEGTLQAMGLLEGMGVLDGATGPFRVELFAGSPDDERTEPSFAAAMSVLQPYLDSGILSVGSGETTLDQVSTLRGNAEAAASRFTRIVRDSYAGVVPDAVLTPSDAIARAVAGAAIASGDGRVPVLSGRGAELRSLVALLDGRQYLTLLEDPRALAGEAADRVLDALAPALGASASADPGVTGVDNGARPIPASLLQPVAVRAPDIHDLVIDSGYWSQQRLDEAVARFGLPTEPEATATPTPIP